MSSGDGNEFLRASRRDLAELWRRAEETRLPHMFAGDLGRMHRVLVSGAVQYAPVSEDELETARAGVQQAREGQSIGALLAAMLYERAHRIGVPVDFERVPAWLLKDYLAWL